MLYPPAMVALATLMRDRGELESAALLLHAVETIAPEQNHVLVGLAATYLMAGDVSEARSYLGRVSTKGASSELREMVAGLRRKVRETIEHPVLAEFRAFADNEIARQDTEPISLTVSLAAALKGLPFRWLNAVAENYGITDIRRRPEREAALTAALLDADRLLDVLAKAPPDVLLVLQTALSAGGWCKLSRLERAFGKQDGDGMWWVEGPPHSLIGMARYLGLLYVGRALVDGKRHLVAVVPVELRDRLSAVVPEAMKSQRRHRKKTD